MMPVPPIKTPGFSFMNITIGVMLRIYFDRRPMTLTFMLATPDNKAIVAAGVYGGCFHCALTAEPKRGLRAIEMSLEMGAYQGIQLGPIRGEVKFMIGLFYRKDDFGVLLEGYFIAEGRLSVWIIRVHARLYMFVRSRNGEVKGGCTVVITYKNWPIKKRFRGSYSKTLKGASSSGNSNSNAIDSFLKTLPAKSWEHQLQNKATAEAMLNIQDWFGNEEFGQMSTSQWTEFYNAFYK
jgi:hypothetical protein